MGRNAQARKAKRAQAAEDRFFARPSKPSPAPMLKCAICGAGETPVVDGYPPIQFRRRSHCTEHLGIYLMTRILRKRGLSKRDAARELVRILTDQQAAQAEAAAA